VTVTEQQTDSLQPGTELKPGSTLKPGQALASKNG
jgi:hypothetical protein